VKHENSLASRWPRHFNNRNVSLIFLYYFLTFSIFISHILQSPTKSIHQLTNALVECFVSLLMWKSVKRLNFISGTSHWGQGIRGTMVKLFMRWNDSVKLGCHLDKEY
jgi:hypothetical protein